MMPDAIVTMSEKEMLHRLRNLEQINEFLIRFLLDVSSHLDAALGEDGLGSARCWDAGVTAPLKDLRNESEGGR